MASTPVLVQGLSDALGVSVQSLVSLKKVTVPFTTITGRTKVTDFSQDLLPRMGVDRFAIQSIMEVQGEYGPNGERSFKPINDVHDQVRFVGAGLASGGFNTSNGIGIDPGDNAGFVEVTFYGTGLNALAYQDATAKSFGVSVDGGGSVTVANTGAGTLNGRNYSQNTIIVLASGLTLGMHTIKLTFPGASRPLIFGFEFVNTSGTSPNTLQLLAGSSYVSGKKLSKTSLTVDSYNTNFETGALGTSGGHAVIYQKSDGTIGKAVQPTDASSLLYPNVNHSNESVIRSYSWREFGAGRADDFSTLAGTPRAATFVLDDGTTTLVTDSSSTISYNATDGIRTSTSGTNFITFTFVGTGLDILVDTDGAARPYSLVVDGGSTLVGSILTINGPQTIKVASGLPYGTHVVKWICTSASASPPAILKFIVYGPVKPTIPTGAVELADYYVMANFVTGTTGLNNIATGVLRKFNSREIAYSGSVNTLASSPTDTIGGLTQSSTGTGGKFSYSFYGTGFELRFRSAGLGANTIQVDGSPNISAFTVTAYGATGVTNTTTGAISFAGGNVGAGIRVTGLTLGFHSVDVTQGVGGQWIHEAFDIVTPIHSQRSDQPGTIQTALAVGSQGIGDSRVFSTSAVKSLANWAQAVGVTSGPTTTSASGVPVTDMLCIVKTTGNPIEISYSISATITASTASSWYIFVDGIQVGNVKAYQPATASAPFVVSDSIIVPVSAGIHTVQLFAATNSGTLTFDQVRRNIKVREIS